MSVHGPEYDLIPDEAAVKVIYLGILMKRICRHRSPGEALSALLEAIPDDQPDLAEFRQDLRAVLLKHTPDILEPIDYNPALTAAVAEAKARAASPRRPRTPEKQK